MKAKLGFLSLMCALLYLQGRSCNESCPKDNPNCKKGDNKIQKEVKLQKDVKSLKEVKLQKELKFLQEIKLLKDTKSHKDVKVQKDLQKVKKDVKPQKEGKGNKEEKMQKDGNGDYIYSGGSTSWEDWWTYDGISGPDFWGLLNLEWSLCNKGRRQSPVDIDPASLLYDPSLRPIYVDKIRVNGVITNTGHGVIFRTSAATHAEILNITGGPLSYKYRFSEIHIHFARNDEKGSEHLIAGAQFPAELQIYGYNSDLYSNITEAMSLQKNQGLVGISVLLQITKAGETSSPELKIITSQLHKIIHRGQEASLKYLSLRELMPDTPYYMTYEGSTTMPGCYETVTWIIMNRPIYITKQQLYALRRLMQGDERNPKAPLADNFRPTLDLNQRSIRTNIDFNRKIGSECPSMSRKMHYMANADFAKGP